MFPAHDKTIATPTVLAANKVEGGLMDEQMASLWTVKRFCKWKYDTDEPTKAQLNTVYKMCAKKKLPALKCGREWRIDIEKFLEGLSHGN